MIRVIIKGGANAFTVNASLGESLKLRTLCYSTRIMQKLNNFFTLTNNSIAFFLSSMVTNVVTLIFVLRNRSSNKSSPIEAQFIVQAYRLNDRAERESESQIPFTFITEAMLRQLITRGSRSIVFLLAKESYKSVYYLLIFLKLFIISYG